MSDEKPPCDGLTDLFFSDEDEEPEKVDEAKSLCIQCPFKDQCLSMGMDEKFGVWGASSPKDRRRIKRLRARDK